MKYNINFNLEIGNLYNLKIFPVNTIIKLWLLETLGWQSPSAVPHWVHPCPHNDWQKVQSCYHRNSSRFVSMRRYFCMKFVKLNHSTLHIPLFEKTIFSNLFQQLIIARKFKLRIQKYQTQYGHKTLNNR